MDQKGTPKVGEGADLLVDFFVGNKLFTQEAS
jgi:hypothetical protein